MAGFIIIAYPIISLLFERGAFSKADTQATVYALQAFALGLPAFVLIKIFATSFFAREDTRTPVKIAVFCLGLNVALTYTLMQMFSYVGIAPINIYHSLDQSFPFCSSC